MMYSCFMISSGSVLALVLHCPVCVMTSLLPYLYVVISLATSLGDPVLVTTVLELSL
jgi:hypothetical protein